MAEEAGLGAFEPVLMAVDAVEGLRSDCVGFGKDASADFVVLVQVRRGGAAPDLVGGDFAGGDEGASFDSGGALLPPEDTGEVFDQRAVGEGVRLPFGGEFFDENGEFAVRVFGGEDDVLGSGIRV